MSEILDEFASDTHRRVAANLHQPRTAEELADYLAKSDPYVDDLCYTADGVLAVIGELQAEGLVAELTAPVAERPRKRKDAKAAAEAIVQQVKDHPAARNLHRDKAKNFVDRLQRRDLRRRLADTHYVATQAFYDRIAAPIPNEPPPIEEDED